MASAKEKYTVDKAAYEALQAPAGDGPAAAPDAAPDATPVAQVCAIICLKDTQCLRQVPVKKGS